MKYQDIEIHLREADTHPRLKQIIQYLHAENVGLKQEISGICRGLDVMIDTMNKVLTIAGMQHEIFKGIDEGKSMSETIAEMRAEHLSDIVSEEVKQ